MINYFGGSNFGWPSAAPIFQDFSVKEENHIYSLYLAKSKDLKVYKLFSTRRDAELAMEDICKKNNLHIINMFDEKHYKTYITDQGSEFHINRI